MSGLSCHSLARRRQLTNAGAPPSAAITARLGSAHVALAQLD
jgi:hypothetical protein